MLLSLVLSPCERRAKVAWCMFDSEVVENMTTQRAKMPVSSLRKRWVWVTHVRPSVRITKGVTQELARSPKCGD